MRNIPKMCGDSSKQQQKSFKMKPIQKTVKKKFLLKHYAAKNISESTPNDESGR